MFRFRRRAENVSSKEIRYAARWFWNRLCPEKDPEIRIDFRPAKNFLKPGAKKGMRGYSNFTGEWYRVRLCPHVHRSSTLLDLAHELTHVKQWERGELDDVSFGPGFVLCQWKGKKILETDTMPHSQYENLPWEKDAVRSARNLLRAYRRHLKRQGLKFPG